MFCCVLNYVLISRNITQSKLYKDTGIRPQTINDLYHNKYTCVSLSVLDKLCRYLNCEPGNLFVMSDKKGLSKIKQESEEHIGVYEDDKLICTLDAILSEKQLTAKWLSEKTSIRPSTISNIRNNTASYIRKNDLESICRILNIEVKDLYKYKRKEEVF